MRSSIAWRRAATVAASVLSVAVLAVAAGCGDDDEDAAAGGGASTAEQQPEKKDVTVAMVIGLTSNPFMQLVEDGARDGVADVPGATLKYTGPPQPNPTQQTKMFRDVLSTNPDGVAIMPLQATLWVRPLKDAATTDIPMLAFNEAPLPGSDIKTFVGINDRQGAESLLKVLVDKVGADAAGTVVLGNCISGVRTLDFRITAYKEALARMLPNVKVKGPIQTTTEPSENLANWKRLMAANRDALAFIGNCDADGPGLVKAKKESGVDGEILTFDTNMQTLRGIKDGTMLAALNEAPYVRGYISTRLLAEAAQRGEDVPEGFVNIEGEIVTSENVDAVMEREASVESLRAGYADFLEEFFKDPAAKMEPLDNVYK